MSEIICAAVDCAHVDDYNCCRLNKVTFNEHYVHTVHNGLQHFWTCNMYEKSEETKRLERMFMECMRKDGINGI